MLPSDRPRGRRIDILSRLLRQPWRFLLKGKAVTRVVLLLSVGGMLMTSLPLPLRPLGVAFVVWGGIVAKKTYSHHRRRGG